MSRQNNINLNKLLKQIPSQVIVTAKWLSDQGISSQLLSKYKKSGWFKMLANGAYVKLNDKFNLDGAIYALQNQLGLSIHIGGVSSLDKQGIVHNISFNRKIYLYSARGETLPQWFRLLFKDQYYYVKTNFLPKTISLAEDINDNFSTKIASKERAILEMLYLAPEKNSLREAYQLMELMLTLDYKLLQQLLEKCSSIKVKRLFLYLAEKVGYPGFSHLDLTKFNLGTGKRVIVKGGTLDKKYNIVIDNIGDI